MERTRTDVSNADKFVVGWCYINVLLTSMYLCYVFVVTVNKRYFISWYFVSGHFDIVLLLCHCITSRDSPI